MKKQNLVFIHGFRGSSLGLEDLAKCFDKKKYNIYLPDLPPAGDNTLPEYTARHYARFVANFIKSKKLKDPILIGHSMGSIIVSATAERYPELLGDKIVLLSPISVHPSWFFKMLTPLSAFLPNKVVGYITTKYLFVPKDKALFRRTLLTTYHCGAAQTNRRDIYKSAKFSCDYAISDFTFDKTAIFISGEKDRLIPRKKTESVASNFKNANTIWIPNTGHLLNYEDPKSTASAIKKFLKK
ncbi:alpha/beta hydrolase [Candidatus Saccharibacteria bacterium]|nr:alpha/beta hydrolase [Candidatus Saccharibacteria bacterium]